MVRVVPPLPGLLAGLALALGAGAGRTEGPPSQDASRGRPLLPAAGVDADDRALLAVEVASSRSLVGSELHVRIAFGLDGSLASENLLQLFRIPLELPVLIELPWADGTDCLRVLPAKERAGGPTFALNGRVAHAVAKGLRSSDGRTYRMFEHELVLVPTCAGPRELPGGSLHFAYATRFRPDLLGNPKPLDRREALVHGAPLHLEVSSAPEQGRPPGFTGAIGSFHIATRAEPRAVTRGGRVDLVLRIEVDGDSEQALTGFEPPRPEADPAFHLLGVRDERRDAARILTYDFTAAAEGARPLPELRFSYFDPAPDGGYRTLIPDPIVVRVLPPDEPAAADRDRPPPRSAPGLSKLALLALALFGALLLALGIVSAVRRVARGDATGKRD